MPAELYRGEAVFFVTVVTRHRALVLGTVCDNLVRLSAVGGAVEACWDAIPSHFAGARLGPRVIMPNHLHGLVTVPQGRSLIALVGSFKAASTRRAGVPAGSLWQRSFHDRLVRDVDELDAIEGYIAENPLRWGTDRENPAARRTPGRVAEPWLP